jgi:hypothetical protein
MPGEIAMYDGGTKVPVLYAVWRWQVSPRKIVSMLCGSHLKCEITIRKCSQVCTRGKKERKRGVRIEEGVRY